MSTGGGIDLRSNRSQAWDQVWDEFHLDVPQVAVSTCNATSRDSAALRDEAAHLATMLPSKQAQHTIGNVALDWLLSIENIPNEERTWEEIMRIKAMPVNMAQKMALKSQFKNANQGFAEIKWQRKKFWQRCKANIKDFYSKFELWQGSLKTIEGNFGVGVVSLFVFIKWLMFLNIFIFSLPFLLIVVPSALLEEPGPPGECDLSGNDTLSIACCVEQYQNQTSASSNFFFFDLVQGTGWMEKTLLFYGHYSSDVYSLNGGDLFYDLPLAYLISTLLYFLVSLFAIVTSAARGFRERIIMGEGQSYGNLIFSGWDFCMDKPKHAVHVHKAIFNEIKACLEAERLQTERRNPTRKQKFRLFLSRALVNTAIIAMLLASMVAIYYVFTQSRALLRTSNESKMLMLFFEFMPYLLIVSLNLLLPLLFTFLVDFEHYSPIVVVRITLLRTVFLRLSSLGVLGASIYPLVSCYRQDGCVCNDGAPLCWETYVGQQFYKLAVTNAFSGIAVTFFINFPRAVIAKYFEGNKIIGFVCGQQFELPSHALDVVYSQTLCWIGSFYSPLLPAFAVVHCFLTFYVKKFACLVNSNPPLQIYRTSRSNYMFITVLLISYVAAAIAVGYSLTEVRPSRSCGPFKGDAPVWHTLIASFSKLPSWIQGFASYLGTAAFTLPMIVLLLLAIYYFNAVTAARRQMALVLRRQLLLEGQDKRFLLNQLGAIIEEKKRRQSATGRGFRYPQNLSLCSRRRTMKI